MPITHHFGDRQAPYHTTLAPILTAHSSQHCHPDYLQSRNFGLSTSAAKHCFWSCKTLNPSSSIFPKRPPPLPLEPMKWAGSPLHFGRKHNILAHVWYHWGPIKNVPFFTLTSADLIQKICILVVLWCTLHLSSNVSMLLSQIQQFFFHTIFQSLGCFEI